MLSRTCHVLNSSCYITLYYLAQNKRIVLYDTLIKQVTEPELLAILGHEIGHWKLGHTIQGFIISQVK